MVDVADHGERAAAFGSAKAGAERPIMDLAAGE
jgi:hypothetical protein